MVIVNNAAGMEVGEGVAYLRIGILAIVIFRLTLRL